MFAHPAQIRGHVVTLLLLLAAETAFPHGGVVGSKDLCVINIGYLKAHFKIFVPKETGHAEYCEDIPVRGESIFVMEYQHDSLNDAAIDFRIIRNVTGKGNFARVDDVIAIDDIDAVTVHYAEPAVVPAVFTLLHTFEDDGDYIGIVSATDDARGTSYSAVFPFEVGYTGIGIWPWVFAALLLLQVNFWYLGRRRKKKLAMLAVVLAAMLVVPQAHADDDADAVFVADGGHFHVRYVSDASPIVINRMHRWTLEITRPDGTPVEGADIQVAGGMPEHNHGMPTRPKVEEDLGDGRYRLAGIRFHMSGYWELRVSIDDGNYRDAVTIPLTLQ